MGVKKSGSPHNEGHQVKGLRRFHERVSLYIVAATLLFMVLACAALVALMSWWGSSLSPVSDAESVLELRQQMQMVDVGSETQE